MGEHRVPDFSGGRALEPIDDRLQSQFIDQMIAEIFGVTVFEQPGQLIDMAHNWCPWINPRAKPTISFADIVQEGEGGEPGADDRAELSQSGSAGEADIDGRLGQQRLYDCGDIS